MNDKNYCEDIRINLNFKLRKKSIRLKKHKSRDQKNK